MPEPTENAEPTWLDLESVKTTALAERVTSLSADTLKRRYGHLFVKLSPRREGIKLRHILAIANGEKV